MTETPEVKNRPEIHILVVEDDWFALNLCLKALLGLGFERLETARDGKMALEIMRQSQSPVDLIILDLNLPEMNGMEFIQAIHKLDYAGALVILSGEDEDLMEATYDLAVQSGIRILDAIPKPVNREYFTALLERFASDLPAPGD